MRVADPRVALGLHRSRHERCLLTRALDLGVTVIDTSTNYLGFLSHETLSRTAGDLMPKFTISTKVGYFRRPGRAEHSLDPLRLRAAIEQTVRDLGREPDLVFLHNPEHSLHETARHSRDALARACTALEDATARGLCGAWGIASWDPTRLSGLIQTSVPRPSVLMVRAGLLVGARTLDAADALSAAWRLDDGMVWGMSPFGGSTNTPVWDRVDPRVFLRDGANSSRVQAAFRAAYLLPQVGTVAVGTNEPTHLSELISALACEVDERAIDEYRSLLRDHVRSQPA
ncbi:aldo/keto reductase [Streptomyces sp. NPDC014995]|uniref:aldo/keto reductase n=1 Tax=Streptomyces sp. NPDC014995 TaxID=3364936 RepID=UPI0036F9E562